MGDTKKFIADLTINMLLSSVDVADLVKYPPIFGAVTAVTNAS